MGADVESEKKGWPAKGGASHEGQDADVAQWVSRSRRRQGLPSKVMDKTTLDQLANTVTVARRFRPN